MKSMLSIALASAVMVMAVPAAQATPLAPNLKAAVEAEASLIQKTHGFHRYCARGPVRWHRHDRYGRNVPCYRRGPRWY